MTAQLPTTAAQPFLIRLRPAQAERLRAQAEAAGLSQSAYVARLLDGDLATTSRPDTSQPATPVSAPSVERQEEEGGEGGRVDLRLRPADRALLESRATPRGLSRARYVLRLLRSHLMGTPQFDIGELAALRSANRELTMVGINLNQIARALNVDVVDRQQTELEVLLPELRQAVAGLRDSLRNLISANLRSWEGEA